MSTKHEQQESEVEDFKAYTNAYSKGDHTAKVGGHPPGTHDHKKEKDYGSSDEEDCKRHKKQKKEEIELYFVSQMSFEQELVPKKTVTDEIKFVPRKESDEPRGVSGKIVLSFDKFLSAAHYKVYVYGVEKHPRNKNELVTQAHIHLGRAYQAGPVVVELFKYGPLTEKGIPSDGLLAKGKITNKDIRNISFDDIHVNSVASLLGAIRRGQIYADVHGSNVDKNEPSYLPGLVRGQIFASRTD